VSRIVPTIAYQLARLLPAYRQALVRQIGEDTEICARRTERQFEKLIRDPLREVEASVPEGIVVTIDALDECVTDLPKLLEFVTKQSSMSHRVKWIVSSRNWPAIEAQLEQAGHKVRLSLKLNAKLVAAAVDIFIHQKVDQLAQEKQYKPEVQHAVLQHLTSNANDTFL
jgi:hypothetical protein